MTQNRNIRDTIPEFLRSEKKPAPEQLWTFIISMVKMYRRNGGEDGLRLWAIMKEYFEGVPNTQASAWKTSVCPGGQLYDTWAQEFQRFSEYENGELVVKNHFFHQLNNIPQDKPANLLRLLQVALNIGQGYGSTQEILGDGFIDEHWDQMTDIQTYMDRDVYSQFQVSDELVERFIGEFGSVCFAQGLIQRYANVQDIQNILDIQIQAQASA